eukprot:COSAG01_NODE_5956_length_3935_cov_5.884515_1_plen_1269_part_10
MLTLFESLAQPVVVAVTDAHMLHVRGVKSRNEVELKAIFSQFGLCTRVAIREHKPNDSTSSWALVIMASIQAAQMALAAEYMWASDAHDLKVTQYSSHTKTKTKGRKAEIVSEVLKGSDFDAQITHFTEAQMLHVRGIRNQSEGTLQTTFGKWARGADKCSSIVVRERQDKKTGQNTSWALVIMDSAESAQQVKRESHESHAAISGMTVEPYIAKITSTSKGGSVKIIEQAMQSASNAILKARKEREGHDVDLATKRAHHAFMQKELGRRNRRPNVPMRDDIELDYTRLTHWDIEPFDGWVPFAEGDFCKVFRVKNVAPAIQVNTRQFQVVAVKIPKLIEDAKLKAEVELLSALDHENVVQVLGMAVGDAHPDMGEGMRSERCMMVLEFCESNLEKLLYDKGNIAYRNYSWQLMGQLCLQIVDGMAYVHRTKHGASARNYMHLDLKPQNILLAKTLNPEGSPVWTAKCGDFGWDPTQNQMQRTGTPLYMAPEFAIRNLKLDMDVDQPDTAVGPEADVFSFGVLLWEMFERKTPLDALVEKRREAPTCQCKNPCQTTFGGQTALCLRKVSTWMVGEEHLRPDFLDTFPKPLRTLVEVCWTTQLTSRPTFADIKRALTSTAVAWFVEEIADKDEHQKMPDVRTQRAAAGSEAQAAKNRPRRRSLSDWAWQSASQQWQELFLSLDCHAQSDNVAELSARSQRLAELGGTSDDAARADVAAPESALPVGSTEAERTSNRQARKQAQRQTQYLIKKFLQEIELGDLDPNQRIRFAPFLKPTRFYNAGEIIITQGEEADAMYFVHLGSANVWIEGDERDVSAEREGVVQRGGYFGELALLTEQPRAATVEAGPNGAGCYQLNKLDFISTSFPKYVRLRQTLRNIALDCMLDWLRCMYWLLCDGFLIAVVMPCICCRAVRRRFIQQAKLAYKGFEYFDSDSSSDSDSGSDSGSDSDSDSDSSSDSDSKPDKTILHTLLRTPADASSIMAQINCRKRAAKTKCFAYRDENGNMSLHILLSNWASWGKNNEDDAIRLLDWIMKANPAACMHPSKSYPDRSLPLHLAIVNGAPAPAIQRVIDAKPEACREANRDGNLPLHMVLLKWKSWADRADTDCAGSLVTSLVEAHPDACMNKSTNEQLPLHLAIVNGAPAPAIQRVIDANLEACREANRDGNLPLHMVLLEWKSWADTDVAGAARGMCVTAMGNARPLSGLATGGAMLTRMGLHSTAPVSTGMAVTASSTWHRVRRTRSGTAEGTAPPPRGSETAPATSHARIFG